MAGGDEGESKPLTITIGAQQVFSDDMVPMTQEGVYLANGTVTSMMDRSDTLTITFAAAGLSEFDQAPIREVHVSVLKPDVSISTVKGDATEVDDPTMTFRVSRDGPVDDSLDVQIGNVTGTATEGSDYSSFPGSVSIPAGQSYADFSLSVIDDPDAEGDETVIVALADPGTTKPYTANPAATTQAVIHDNPSVKSVEISVETDPAANVPHVNQFNGFDFRVKFRIEGEALNRLMVRQLVRNTTDLKDTVDGTWETQGQVHDAFAGSYDTSILNTTDYVQDTNWAWGQQPIQVDPGTNQGAGWVKYDIQRFMLDRHIVHLDLATAHDTSQIAVITNAFRFQIGYSDPTAADTDGVYVVEDKDWGYTWSNMNCEWNDGRQPGVVAWDGGPSEGEFTNVTGIDGLPF